MVPDVIVIGGGLSGLSAAVDLVSRGSRVLLLEQRPFLGGRTYSFVDETTGDVVDNGQHLLMGCYRETRRFLKVIGSDDLATLQPNLQIDFLYPDKGRAALSCPPLPAPFHVLAGLLNLRTLPLRDRLKLLRVGMELLFRSSAHEERLRKITVDEWLTQLGQTDLNKKYLWDIIAIGTLNDNPTTVSALLFYRVLRAAFVGAREDSCLLVPRVGLSELLVNPAVRFIRSHGGEVRVGVEVEEILIRERRVSGIRAGDGSVVQASAYISAVPYYALPELVTKLRGSSTPEHQNSSGVPAPTTSGTGQLPQNFDYLKAFESSPIITIHLWLDRPVIEQEFAAILDARVQWIFNRSDILGRRSSAGRQYLSLVISGAAEYVAMEKEQLVAIAIEDLRRVLPGAESASVVHSLVIKEKRATFSPTPEVEPLRPSTDTAFENLFLAGDWTDTGLPATIEGAVRSGFRAGRKASDFLEKLIS
ncbi:MAG: hydroxysqualene dehydroxylase HpnE [Bacteroidota bacterium]